MHIMVRYRRLHEQQLQFILYNITNAHWLKISEAEHHNSILNPTLAVRINCDLASKSGTFALIYETFLYMNVGGGKTKPCKGST